MSLKKSKLVYAMVISMVLLLLLFNWHHKTQASKPVIHQLTKTTIKQAEPLLVSKIPVYYIMAIRQTVEPMSVRRVELTLTSEDDEDVKINESLVLLDKVIVIPDLQAS